MKFHKLLLEPRIVKSLAEDYQFTQATEIQKLAIPQILKRKNVLGIAPSGTGKTIAYLAPIVHQIVAAKVDHALPLALILSPTRELARQIEEEAIKIGKYCSLNIVGIISHRPENKILNKLKEPADLIVGTPIKILQYVNTGKIDLSQLQHVVLDECDRLLEFGFYEIIKEIHEKFRKNKVNRAHFFSATLPEEVGKLARELMISPTIIEVAKLKTSHRLKQNVYEVLEENKLILLTELLQSKAIRSVIIFCRTKEAARYVAKTLLQNGLDLEEIHGGLTDVQRIKALDAFQNGDTQVLVATDLISRGINIDKVSHVVNFDVPKLIDDYIHRVGRTARAGEPGIAVTLACPDDLHKLEKFEKILGIKMQRIKKLPKQLRISSYEQKIVEKKQKTKKLSPDVETQPKKKKHRFGKGWSYKNKKYGARVIGKQFGSNPRKRVRQW